MGEHLALLFDGHAPRLAEIAPHLPADLDGFFERALKVDPALRFQTADELARAVVALAKGSWRPPPPSAEARGEPERAPLHALAPTVPNEAMGCRAAETRSAPLGAHCATTPSC